MMYELHNELPNEQQYHPNCKSNVLLRLGLLKGNASEKLNSLGRSFGKNR